MSVFIVTRADEHDVGLGQRHFERHEVWIVDVRVGADDAAAFERQQLSQLVRERRRGRRRSFL